MTDVLDDLLSRDSQRIWQASWDVIRTRDVAVLEVLRAALPQIRSATAGVELGGMIQPNRTTLEHALDKVRNYRTWHCWCDDYPRLLSFDPAREATTGHVRIIMHNDSGWPVIYECECLVCGRRFAVEEGEYHSTWWKWSPETRRQTSARRAGQATD